MVKINIAGYRASQNRDATHTVLSYVVQHNGEHVRASGDCYSLEMPGDVDVVKSFVKCIFKNMQDISVREK